MKFDLCTTKTLGNIHPWNHGGDPFVLWSEPTRLFVMHRNHPVVVPGIITRWFTAIAVGTSDDGVIWDTFAQESAMRYPPDISVVPPEQYETPCEGPPGFEARLAYQKKFTWTGSQWLYRRNDHIQILKDREVISKILPRAPWSVPFRNRAGSVLGGPQEPSLLKVGPFLVCLYSGGSYAGGIRPVLLGAASLDEGLTWLHGDMPLLTDSESQTGMGQVQVTQVRGEQRWVVTWQRRKGTSFKVMQSETRNFIDFDPPRELFNNTTFPEWSGRISGACPVFDDKNTYVYFFGEPDPASPFTWTGRVTL